MRLDLLVALVRAAAAPGERLLGGLHELLFPRLYLVRVRLGRGAMGSARAS